MFICASASCCGLANISADRSMNALAMPNSSATTEFCVSAWRLRKSPITRLDRSATSANTRAESEPAAADLDCSLLMLRLLCEMVRPAKSRLHRRRRSRRHAENVGFAAHPCLRQVQLRLECSYGQIWQ